jgi:hypothetical protein
MKVIIAGSRAIVDQAVIDGAVKASRFKITEVVCGMARGVDLLGRAWAAKRKVPVAEFPADWGAHGKAAGYLRNVEMAKYADALVAVWDGTSPGTTVMIDEARRRGLKVYVMNLSEEPR